MPYIATRDIFSYCNNKHRYTARFDELTIIKKSHHVLIVENKKGSRFSVNENLVLEVDNNTLKKIQDINSIIKELLDRKTTPANAQRIRIQEQKITQILK